MGGSGEQGEGGRGDQGEGGDDQGPAAGGEPNAGGAGGADTGGEDSPEAFFQTQCAACHGATGQGVEGLGPDIAHPVDDYSTWVVRNGREGGELYPTGMMVFDESVLSDEMLEGILAFLADQPQPTSGEGLYSDYCAACHGADGNGGPTGRAIKNEVGEVSRLVRSGHDLGNFAVRREFMPQWSADELSDAELQLISEYIQSL